MRRPTPPTCRMTHWRAYNAALKPRGSLQISELQIRTAILEPLYGTRNAANSTRGMRRLNKRGSSAYS